MYTYVCIIVTQNCFSLRFACAYIRTYACTYRVWMWCFLSFTGSLSLFEHGFDFLVVDFIEHENKALKPFLLKKLKIPLAVTPCREGEVERILFADLFEQTEGKRSRCNLALVKYRIKLPVSTSIQANWSSFLSSNFLSSVNFSMADELSTMHQPTGIAYCTDDSAPEKKHCPC